MNKLLKCLLVLAICLGVCFSIPDDSAAAASDDAIKALLKDFRNSQIDEAQKVGEDLLQTKQVIQKQVKQIAQDVRKTLKETENMIPKAPK